MNNRIWYNKEDKMYFVFFINFGGEKDMVVWSVLLGLAVLVSVVIASVILPRTFLKTRYTIASSGDRGLKKIYEKNGQSILFEPIVKWRKYIKQYILAERNEKKELICKIDPEIEYLAYDIVLFNSLGKAFDVITVKELIEKSGYTKTVALPEQTSYVSLAVTAVDGMKFEENITKRVKAGKLAKFLLLCSFCILLEVFAVKICCANVFGGVFRESFVLNVESTIATLFIAGGLILINLIVAFVAIKIRGAKKANGNKTNG